MKLKSKMKLKAIVNIGAVTLVAGLIVGCSDSSNSPSAPEMNDYEITLINLSSNQPLSPMAVIIHEASYSGWAIGTASTAGLEHLAEGGDNSTFLVEARTANAPGVESGEGVIIPGGSELVDVSVHRGSDLKLTVASMLVNTNDAFTGGTGIDLSSLSIGDELKVRLPIYDAGTEVNNELVGTIPGPADGGEGFNSDRDDVNVVSRHPGVVSNVDGYTDSVLEQSHRFDSPIAQLVVRRVN